MLTGFVPIVEAVFELVSLVVVVAALETSLTPYSLFERGDSCGGKISLM